MSPRLLKALIKAKAAQVVRKGSQAFLRHYREVKREKASK